MSLLLLSLQSCPTLCDPTDGSPPGSPVPGILQARALECISISFSSPQKWKVKVKSLSCAWLLVTSWTAAYQAPLSIGFSKSTGVGCHCLLRLYVIRELQIMTSRNIIPHLLEWQKSQTLTASNAGKVLEQQEQFIVGGNTKWYSPFGWR